MGILFMPETATAASVKELCSRFGTVVSVNHNHTHSRAISTYGKRWYVEFADVEEARRCFKTMQYARVDGHITTVVAGRGDMLKQG